MLDLWDEQYNAQNWADLASLYQPDALLINTSDENGSYIRGEIAGKFFSEQEHLENMKTVPTNVHQESPAVIHMNFSYTHKGGSAKKHGYARIVKQEEELDGEWKFALSVSANFVFIPTENSLCLRAVEQNSRMPFLQGNLSPQWLEKTKSPN